LTFPTIWDIVGLTNVDLSNERPGIMSSTTPPFGTQLIGQTEKAMNAILDRLLAGSGLTEPQWVTLTLAVMSGGSVHRDGYADRIADGLKIEGAQARGLIAELAAAGLLEVPDNATLPVTITDAGRELHASIAAAAKEVTERLWGDLDADELAVAGRVLGVVLDRANRELARA
jgi:DNA-binding MarR family transcriptional regulator